MTTTENKQIHLDKGVGEAIEQQYRETIKEEIIKCWPETLKEQPELIQQLLSEEYIKNRFIEILTEETLKEAKEQTKGTATIRSKGGSNNIW